MQTPRGYFCMQEIQGSRILLCIRILVHLGNGDK